MPTIDMIKNCPYCGSQSLRRKRDNFNGRQIIRFQCMKCDTKFVAWEEKTGVKITKEEMFDEDAWDEE